MLATYKTPSGFQVRLARRGEARCGVCVGLDAENHEIRCGEVAAVIWNCDDSFRQRLPMCAECWDENRKAYYPGDPPIDELRELLYDQEAG